MRYTQGVSKAFGTVLRAHVKLPNTAAMAGIQDHSFAVLRSSHDASFFDYMATILLDESKKVESGKEQKKAQQRVHHNLKEAIENFLALSSGEDTATTNRAVVTATLSLIRSSFAPKIPPAVSKVASMVVLNAFDRASEPYQIALGASGFPEAQVAAFFYDATRRDAPPRTTRSIVVPAHITVKLVRTLGVGRAVRNGSEWGSPDVSDSLRRSVRKLAMRLREIGEWKAMGELVDNIKAKEGLTDAENVLGFPYAEMVSDAVRDEEWAFAQMLVSSAAPRKVRRGLARVLIPAAVEANATEVAWRVVVDCGLTSEYPHVEELKAIAHTERRKSGLKRMVEKPGWKLAQTRVQGDFRRKEDLRPWLVGYMLELGNLPAASQLMDSFDLRDKFPPLDPRDVEASARKRAEAFLQLSVDSSKVVLVNNLEGVRQAREALKAPPEVRGGGEGSYSEGREGGRAGVKCVGLDVENSPTSGRATLLQVATSTDVFLFDLFALCTIIGTERHAEAEVEAGEASGRPVNDGRLQRLKEFDTMIGDLFTSRDIVKIGFAFSGDMAALRRTWPNVSSFRQLEALLEMSTLSDAVLGESNPSLAKTCNAWLGKPLDKTECASTWAVRPLTADQLRYAALDAHCLVKIFEKMMMENGGKLGGTGGTERDDSEKWWTRRLENNVSQDRSMVVGATSGGFTSLK